LERRPTTVDIGEIERIWEVEPVEAPEEPIVEPEPMVPEPDEAEEPAEAD
jgi:hypothetical protein